MELELTETENNDYEYNFKQTEQYKEQIYELNSGVHLLLNEFISWLNVLSEINKFDAWKKS